MRYLLLVAAAIMGTLLSFSGQLQAAHIIGGEITYECLGWTNGDPSTNSRSYQFYLKIYRDCQGGGADFDSGPGGAFDATVSIYLEGQSNEYLNIVLEDLIVNSVDPGTDNPCVIVPPNVCVEQGLYTFPIVDLPVSTSSYFITYQRCCRNNTISNINFPGDSGASYFMELTPDAQDVCNNSPEYDNFPPAVICVGEELIFDHSATDADGDQLVYEFCTPFLGGGLNFDDPENTIDGLAPNPDAPPPYAPVSFIPPNYSALSPLGIEANIAIDFNTGIITGIPTVTGQFVVGVCVQEFRDGELLSVVRRDFQFNVAPCEATVVADVVATGTVGSGDYFIQSCGEKTVTVINQSYQQAFIEDFFWTFNLGDTDTVITTWNATVPFPELGQYTGQLVLNPGSPCGDSANVAINILPGIEADFDFEYDTCVAGPVQFQDLSEAEDGDISNWNWDFGEGTGSSNPSPTYIYKEAGNQPVKLRVTGTGGCQDSILKLVPYFPVPALILVSPSAFDGCVPGNIVFTNLSEPVNSDYEIFWDFGDGNTSSEFSPSHTYTKEGTYSIALDIISPIGCQTDTVFNDLITIEPGPISDFDYVPGELDNFNSIVQFSDQSTRADRWYYDFGNGAYSTQQNPIYEFRDTGIQEVRLIVTHPKGCRDTSIQFLDVVPKVTFFMPNAFSPNEDGVNDLFMGRGYLEGYSNFEMTIWNRWGEEIFRTTDPSEAWNGRKNNTGRPVQQEVYYYLVRFTGPRGQQTELRGPATLIR